MEVKLSDLVLAVDFSSSGLLFHSCVFLNRRSGKIVYTGDLIDDDELPTDLYDNPDFLEIPSKQDMNLGKQLVLRFAAEHLSDHLETIEKMFSRRGAYGRYKAFLEQTNKLDEWHSYEESAVSRELLEWCFAHEIAVNKDT